MDFSYTVFDIFARNVSIEPQWKELSHFFVFFRFYYVYFIPIRYVNGNISVLK